LQATASHAKSHGIHIYMTSLSSTVSHVVIFRPIMQIVIHCRVIKWPWGIRISEYRYIYLDLTTTSRPDIGGQCWESDMRIGNLIRDELRPQRGAGRG